MKARTSHSLKGITRYEDLDKEFTQSIGLTPAATVNVDYDSGSVFRFEPNQNTTIDLVNIKLGTKIILLDGNATNTAHGLIFTYSGSAGTPVFTKIGSQGFDGLNGKIYRVQIDTDWDGINEVFTYQILELG